MHPHSSRVKLFFGNARSNPSSGEWQLLSQFSSHNLLGKFYSVNTFWAFNVILQCGDLPYFLHYEQLWERLCRRSAPVTGIVIWCSSLWSGGTSVYLPPMHQEPPALDIAGRHTVPVTKPFASFAASHYQSSCYKVPGAHNNTWLRHIWHSFSLKDCVLSPQFHIMLHLFF